MSSERGPVKATRENFYTADRAELYENRDKMVRDKWVKIMKLRIVREKLHECYHREGVNHLQNCRALVERYLKDLPDARIGGPPPMFRKEEEKKSAE
ncbi:hypothetical protein GGI25_005672 [Coemansia spiralis]|uniref:NADH-ubiquinone oxidoreductase 12 kDa subunit n=2 Tax=Coemansia TaxID=4863 RepID=A0A9W8G1W3_9FUNG|nr:hypothetical protein BX070DRAFT_264257 [Coemansia spiralis]KAJ1987573.1 hypothetical protein EDC05_005763 [Coemansia umbellata]KAJ2619378.1 hypothetical protein GGI26_005882 [Coemansia sp. RSA 1358]KAJ2670920.1 hypothetical protein GGI25_005672 [Coemansia spiralis]